MLSASKRTGRKIGGRCRSKILNVRTGPRRVFPDAAEVAKRVEARMHERSEFVQHRAKGTVLWSERDGHRVVEVKRPLPIVQLLKSRR